MRASLGLILGVLLAGAALGFGLAFAFRGHQAKAAEARAVRAEQQYARTQAAESLYRRQHAADLAQHLRDSTLADSAQRAADTRLAAARTQASQSDVRATARIQAAVTLEEQLAVYQALYGETLTERDNALLVAEEQKRAAGRFAALALQADSLRRKAEDRGNLWKQTADSLDLANADLLAHRRPSIGLPGLVVGALTTTATAGLVCLAVKKPC